MTAAAVVACVALVCTSGLVAWRWYLTSLATAAQKSQVDIAAALARLGEFERRLETCEIRANSTLRK